jgi:hypothetical protein
MFLLTCSISYGYYLYLDHLEHEINTIQYNTILSLQHRSFIFFMSLEVNYLPMKTKFISRVNFINQRVYEISMLQIILLVKNLYSLTWGSTWSFNKSDFQNTQHRKYIYNLVTFNWPLSLKYDTVLRRRSQNFLNSNENHPFHKIVNM